jgi:hypothetical protein
MTTTKKTPAQLDREIAEVLSGGSSEGDIAAKASTDPAEWPQIFDRLRPGQTIYVAMTSVMGMRRAESGGYFPHKVGRRSKSRTPRWWTEAITLLPADGSKAHKFAQYKLWKGKSGDVSMSHGDMAVMLKGIYAP